MGARRLKQIHQHREQTKKIEAEAAAAGRQSQQLANSSQIALAHDATSPINIPSRFRERRDDDRFMDDNQQVQPQM